jgi:hypothetical protein
MPNLFQTEQEARDHARYILENYPILFQHIFIDYLKDFGIYKKIGLEYQKVLTSVQ